MNRILKICVSCTTVLLFVSNSAYSQSVIWGDAVEKWKTVEEERAPTTVDICKIKPELCKPGAVAESEVIGNEYLQEWIAIVK